MNDRAKPSALLRVAALVSLVLGVLLLVSTWDSLYDALELPKGSPALSAQLGGLAFVALAYLLWASAGRPALEGLAAAAGAIVYGGGTVVIAAWLIFRDRVDLGIDTAGVIVLIVVAVIFGVLAFALAGAALGKRQGAD